MFDLLQRLFTPVGAFVVFAMLGVFTTLYTAIVKFLFDGKIKDVENAHAVELATIQSRLVADTQVRIENLKATSAKDLKELEAQLTERTQRELQQAKAIVDQEQASRQSRLDYIYEAKKRLYHECEPLIFEFVEFSQNALDRIRGLARTARHGNLPDWLGEDNYYLSSTMYYLLAPVVFYKLMRRRLTTIDLTLDNRIATHYRLAKQLAWSFADDHAFAWGLHIRELSYDPNHPEWRELRREDEPQYWRQGLPYGRLDNAVEALIVRDHEQDGILRIRSFGEFESALHQAGLVADAMTIVRDVFVGFHPERRPVLWRMLVTQAHIYTAILRFSKSGDSSGITICAILNEDRTRLFWGASDQSIMEEPFKVAEIYFQQKLADLWDDQPPDSRSRQDAD
jgi:hypothetical protein